MMKRRPNLFNQSDVDRYINDMLIPQGYEINVLPDTLVDGYVCVPPDDNHKYILFLPYFLNEWSSALELRMFRSWDTIPKKIKAIIEAYEDAEEEEA